MKARTIFTAIALLTMLCMTAVQAQTIEVAMDVFTTPKSLANSAGDSTTGLAIAYEGNAYPALRGLYPDSIKVLATADGDSIYSIVYRFKGKHLGQSVYTSVFLDSLASTTAVPKSQVTLVAGANYWGYEEIGLSVIANSLRNATSTANASETRFRILRYFKVPPK